MNDGRRRRKGLVAFQRLEREHRRCRHASPSSIRHHTATNTTKTGKGVARGTLETHREAAEEEKEHKRSNLISDF